MRGTAARWLAALLASRWLLGGCALAAVAFSGAVRADGPAAPPAPVSYPFDVQLRLSPQAARRVFVYAGGLGPFLPPDPGTEIPVGDQARRAYEVVVRRSFRISEPVAAIELEKVAADLDFDDEGWHAVVEHQLVMRSPAGGEIARWTTRGREPIAGHGPRAMPAAFDGAARRAAEQFETGFETPAGVVSWLRERGVEARPPPVALAPPPPAAPAVPARGLAMHVDLGLGLYLFGGGSGIDGGSLTQQALAARIGVSIPWGFAQVTYARAGLDTSDGLRTPGGEYADALKTYGVEVGPVWQLRYVDLVAGLGLHLATAGGSEAKGASLSAGIRSVRTVSREGTCIRIGFEARREIGETLEVQTSTTERRTLAPASSLWLLLGLEIPFRR